MSDTEDPNTRTARPKRAVKRRVIAPKDAPTTDAPTTDAPTKQAPTKQAPPKQPEPAKVDKRYMKRQPLTKVEHAFLTDFYYKKSGYSGRDVLYKQLVAHYEKHKTPPKMRISRRRMWEFLFAGSQSTPPTGTQEQHRHQAHQLEV